MLNETELQQKFNDYKSALKVRYGKAVYDSWFKSLSLLKLNNGHAVIAAPSNFSASQITERFSAGMFELWHKEIGPICQISIRGMKDLAEFAGKTANIHKPYREDVGRKTTLGALPEKVNRNLARTSAVDYAPRPAQEVARTTRNLASPLNVEQTFAKFCVGEANRVAFMGARSIVDGIDDRMFFVYGASGRGKTHLLNAIGLEWLSRRPDENVLYLTHDNLLNGYVNAVLQKNVMELREYLDAIDILLVDDVHLLRGRKATQDELLHLIDRLISSGKTVVIAGSSAPCDLAETGLSQRLAGRLGGGVCVPIEKPDYQLRMKILQQMAGQDLARSQTYCDDVALQLIARSCDNSLRELEGAYRLVRITTRAEAQGGDLRPLPEEQVRVLLEKHVASAKRVPTMDDLLTAVAGSFGLSVQDLRSRKRMQPIAKGRHAFCLLVRRLTDAPLKAIGAVIDRDHTTVLSSIERGEVLAGSDPVFADRITRLMDDFGG